MFEEFVETIEEKIGYKFNDVKWLKRAFTRSSYANEHFGVQDNEVLEFYGDAVLELVVSNILLKEYSVGDGSDMRKNKEGNLTELRTALVNNDYLASKISEIGIQRYLVKSLGDSLQGNQNKVNVMADLFESIIGAVFCDSGRDLDIVEPIVCDLLGVKEFLSGYNGEDVTKDPICQLNEYFQKSRGVNINLDEVFDDYPAGNGNWETELYIHELGIMTYGYGSQIKDARRDAARQALAMMPKDKTMDQKWFDKFSEARREGNNKGLLEEYCAAEKCMKPQYEKVGQSGAPHMPIFTYRCDWRGMSVCGSGRSIKDAEREAAFEMIQKFIECCEDNNAE